MRRFRIPPMVPDLVMTALQLCDGVIFDRCDVCPGCGGELSGYDLRRRRFAVICENDQDRVISIFVKRFQCRQCGRISPADAPFYPDTRAGSPVVDLCVTLAETMPYHKVSSILLDLGVIVDRGSVRTYALQYRTVGTTEMFGVRLPISVMLLASLAAGGADGDGIRGLDIIAACGNPSGKSRIGGESSSHATEV
jgi:hypothetical protein